MVSDADCHFVQVGLAEFMSELGALASFRRLDRITAFHTPLRKLGSGFSMTGVDPFRTFATRSILPPTLAGFEGESGMTISVKQMIETADAAVPRISPAHARR